MYRGMAGCSSDAAVEKRDVICVESVGVGGEVGQGGEGQGEAGVVGGDTFGTLDQALDERAESDVGCGGAEDAGADGVEEGG